MDGDSLYSDFIAVHISQLQAASVPPHLWKGIYDKIIADTFDAGLVFSLMIIDYSGSEIEETAPLRAVCVTHPDGVKASDPNAVFLIDHAWTFRVSTARTQLESMPQLADRMAAIVGVDVDDHDKINKILRSIWKFSWTYSISGAGLSIENQIPVMYVMDELGSAINHSDNANFRIVPFLHLDTQVTYSLLYPLRDARPGDYVTMDFVECVAKDAPERDAVLLPWKYTNLRNMPFDQFEPDENYFLCGHVPEILPEIPALEPVLDRNNPVKVFSDYHVLCEHLTAPCFELVVNPEEADIIWTVKHFDDYRGLAIHSPNKFINQFPYEYVLTVKDLLSIICRRGNQRHHDPETLETFPSWLPTTFNLKTELVEFASYFQNRERKGLDNHWILKPWNLARSLDTHVTNSIAQIVQLLSTCPKIAQKYINDPVLFFRNDIEAPVKFDIRYVILVRSVRPTEAYIHRKFYLRFANKPFSLDRLDDYETHFTVMNYAHEAQLKNIDCDEFRLLWEQQYPNYPWDEIEDKICEMLHQVLDCATRRESPRGIEKSAQSRALYAADIALSWINGKSSTIQPKLLEINFMPDCERACKFYPEFFNDILKLLFLNEDNCEVFRPLVSSDDK